MCIRDSNGIESIYITIHELDLSSASLKIYQQIGYTSVDIFLAGPHEANAPPPPPFYHNGETLIFKFLGNELASNSGSFPTCKFSLTYVAIPKKLTDANMNNMDFKLLKDPIF